MIAIAITIIICITAVTIVAMVCSTKKMMKSEQTILQEITKQIMERAKNDVQ